MNPIQDKYVIYEQPVNEFTRFCLRLEHLFQQINHFTRKHEAWDYRAALDAILEIMNLIDRSDLKTLFGKELMRQQAILMRLQSLPQINCEKLSEILGKIESLLAAFNYGQGKLGETLRQSDFLSQLRMFRSNPGGLCAFDVPRYHHWLNEPQQKRQHDLMSWKDEVKTIEEGLELVLNLIRNSSQTKSEIAHQGLYQLQLDSKTPCQLIQIGVPADMDVFPLVSVGNRRIFIRFYDSDLVTKPQQTQKSISFQLNCCMM